MMMIRIDMCTLPPLVPPFPLLPRSSIYFRMPNAFDWCLTDVYTKLGIIFASQLSFATCFDFPQIPTNSQEVAFTNSVCGCVQNFHSARTRWQSQLEVTITLVLIALRERIWFKLDDSNCVSTSVWTISFTLLFPRKIEAINQLTSWFSCLR